MIGQRPSKRFRKSESNIATCLFDKYQLSIYYLEQPTLILSGSREICWELFAVKINKNDGRVPCGLLGHRGTATPAQEEEIEIPKPLTPFNRKQSPSIVYDNSIASLPLKACNSDVAHGADIKPEQAHRHTPRRQTENPPPHRKWAERREVISIG